MKKELVQTIETMLRTYRGLIMGSFLALYCIYLGVRLTVIHPGGIVQGIVGSFLIATGMQIALWRLGIRTELFGTMPDPVDANELDYEVRMQTQRLIQRLVDSEREIDELKTKLSQTARRVDTPR